MGTGARSNAIGAPRRHIMLAVEQSLARLQTDRIDLYIIHYFDPKVNVKSRPIRPAFLGTVY